MRCRRTAMEANVEKYEIGKKMEDGFELWPPARCATVPNPLPPLSLLI